VQAWLYLPVGDSQAACESALQMRHHITQSMHGHCQRTGDCAAHNQNSSLSVQALHHIDQSQLPVLLNIISRAVPSDVKQA
jgi:hypothetical protein